MQTLADALGLPLPLATLLVQRGFCEPGRVRAFLRPRLATLSNPLGLAGMAEAVAVIASAVRSGQRILVHGDYDVDGQCAAAVLTRALRIAGADVHPFLPHRMTDGYDFGAAGLAEALRIGAALIVTCDCGITAVEAVARARAAGLRVVVTDHHLPGPDLPPADAVIDPQRADDQSGLGYLCGTGIAFKLVQALVDALGASGRAAASPPRLRRARHGGRRRSADGRESDPRQARPQAACGTAAGRACARCSSGPSSAARSCAPRRSGSSSRRA